MKPKPAKKGPHGGVRANAGRPPKNPVVPPNPDAKALSAQEYLERVVSGQEAPDAVRTRAALGLIRYQRPALRAPIPTPPAGQLAAKALNEQTKAVGQDFQKKAAEIRARHAKQKESK